MYEDAIVNRVVKVVWVCPINEDVNVFDRSSELKMGRTLIQRVE